MSVGVSSALPAFNPAQLGTSTDLWEGALRHGPLLALPECSITVVSPHPDDEVLGAGGLIRAAASAGLCITVVCVTDGEAAYPDWRGLGEIRREEVRKALGVLAATNLEIHHLDLPDGGVDKYRADLALALARRTQKGTLLVAPYERDGHPDHDATGEVCREVASANGLRLWRFPIWTWHHSAPAELVGQQWGRFPLHTADRDAKARAISHFVSQIRPAGREPIVPSHVLRYFERPYEAFLL